MNRIAWLLAAAGLMVLGGCADKQQQQEAERTQKLVGDPVRPVKVQPVSRQTLMETLEIAGSVTTSEDVQVGAKIGGRLAAVYVRDGDPVKAGQIIALQDTSDTMSRVRQAQAQVSAARSQLAQAVSSAMIQPSKSAAAVRAAQAQVRQAKAAYNKVKAGARQEEIKQAESRVEAAQSAVTLAKKELDRTTKLVDEGAIPRARLDAAQNGYTTAVTNYQQALQQLSMQRQWARPEDLEVAREQIRAAEEGVRQAKAQQRLDVLLNEQVSAARANLEASMANLQITRQAISDAQIRAPFSGRIAGKPAQPGTFLAPGSIVCRIVGGSGTYFEGEVPETMISQIEAGKGVRVQLDALPGRSFYGTVAAVSPAGDEVGRLFKVRVQLGAGIEGVKPGMFARGEVDLRAIPNATMVPANAVLESEGQSYVFVAESDSKTKKTKAKKVVVKTGLRKGDLMQVVGLTPGQSVIVQGQTQLAEGTEVKVQGKPTTTVQRVPGR